MAKDLPHLQKIEILSNAYGADVLAKMLGVTERSIQIWVANPKRVPREETMRTLGELFARHTDGEDLAVTVAEPNYKEKYYSDLENQIAELKGDKKNLSDQVKMLQEQLSLVMGQLRHVLLLTHALSETNQDAMIQVMAKLKIGEADAIDEQLGIKNTESYQNMKDELGIVEPLDIGRRVKLK